jgi:hypothetical protein
MEEEQTTEWTKEKVQKDKQRSTKHTHTTHIKCFGQFLFHLFERNIQIKTSLLYLKWCYIDQGMYSVVLNMCSCALLCVGFWTDGVCMFCRSLFVLLYFFFCPFCCLFFFDIRILIASLVSSNSSFLLNRQKMNEIFMPNEYDPTAAYDNG